MCRSVRPRSRRRARRASAAGARFVSPALLILDEPTADADVDAEGARPSSRHARVGLTAPYVAITPDAGATPVCETLSMAAVSPVSAPPYWLTAWTLPVSVCAAYVT